ncbi:MAG: 50S ribosomal protein L11 methyltransferase [Bacillota bacterium]|nr:50S ribosomal protein L11 methyltransferase [Bacillota bacterium]
MNERLIELKITAPAGSDELLAALLFHYGASGVEIDDPALVKRHLQAGDWDASVFDGQPIDDSRQTLRCLFADDETGRAAAAAIAAELAGQPQYTLAQSLIDDIDWQSEWKKAFRPLEIGKNWLVKPWWQEYEGQRTAINVAPGLSFGTGQHQSTAMMLELIEQYLESGHSVMDIGCGSGILAVAALKAGAAHAVAIDIDEHSADTVAEHLRINQLPADSCDVYISDFLADERLQRRLRRDKCQLVMANITAPVLCDLARVVSRFMAPGGTFICSGVLEQYSGTVAQALVNAGLAIIGGRRKDEWVSFAAVAAYE